MMNLDQVIANIADTQGALAQRVIQAQQYRDMLSRDEITADEYQDLLDDLRRLENVQLSAAELDQQIAFYEVMELLKNIPLP